MATILTGTNGDPSTLEVLARATTGKNHATLANSQPFAQQNEVQKAKVLLYQLSLLLGESFFEAITQDVNNATTAPVTLSEYTGILVVTPFRQIQPVAPAITQQLTQVPVPTIVNNTVSQSSLATSTPHHITPPIPQPQPTKPISPPITPVSPQCQKGS